MATAQYMQELSEDQLRSQLHALQDVITDMVGMMQQQPALVPQYNSAVRQAIALQHVTMNLLQDRTLKRLLTSTRATDEKRQSADMKHETGRLCCSGN